MNTLKLSNFPTKAVLDPRYSFRGVNLLIGQKVKSLLNIVVICKATTSRKYLQHQDKCSAVLLIWLTFSDPLNSINQSPNKLTLNLYIATMTLLGTALHLTNFRNPFLRTLVPSISAAFALQAAVAIPSIFAESERFYDLSGSLTYLSVTALSLYLPTLRARAAAAAAGSIKPAWPSIIAALNGTASANGLNWRQVALSVAVGIWATRCELTSIV